MMLRDLEVVYFSCENLSTGKSSKLPSLSSREVWEGKLY